MQVFHNTVRNLGWATDWCGVIARCRYLGILGGRGGHCVPSSEWSRRSCIHGGPLYITVIRPTIFVVVRIALLVARLALCARRLVP